MTIIGANKVIQIGQEYKTKMFKVVQYVLVIVLTSLVTVGQTVITFDETTTSPLSTHTIGNVVFSYTGPYSTIGDTAGPSQSMAYVSPRWISGDARGTLELDFSESVASLGFGVALNGYPATTILNGVYVKVLDEEHSILADTSIDLFSPFWSPEARFDFASGVSDIKTVEITFNYLGFTSYGWDPIFGIDNVTYAVAAVPEPSRLSAIMSALVFIGVWTRRARCQRLRHR